MSSYKGYTLEDVSKITTIKDAKAIAKKMGIAGYTTWKKKNGDLPKAIRIIQREIEDEHKEGEEEREEIETRRRDIDDTKVSIARQISDMTGEDYEWLLDKDLDWLIKLQRDIEDADMRITSSGIPVKKTPKPKPKEELTATERLNKIAKESKPLSKDEINRILGPETGDLDLSVSRSSRAQDILDESGLTIVSW
jgi:hypothetical protein